MLKALELQGFKSFADATRFEFPPGITVVVGPNGSGKSNIVDAMKWVLGAQSAKALRGKEMADVIFKGSARGARKPSNTAEATIIFDNTNNIFGRDTPEIRVTRRVYRSGEGEYLINNEPCRLRDIKDMFRGTGVGTDAYSLIEQGKVDSLLQASAKDRRAIFEEAAGISRFKAKKIEAQRRLDRVDQNLLRLSDIVDEVENRLKRLKSQAGKARRYKEHADRLQSLRTQVGRVDWQNLTTSLTAVDTELSGLGSEADQFSSQTRAVEAALLELESSASLLEDQLRECQEEYSRGRERIAARQATVDSERSRVHEYDEEAVRHRRHVLAMINSDGDFQSEWKRIAREVKTVKAEYNERLAEFNELQARVDEASEVLAAARTRSDTERTKYVDGMRLASELTESISSDQSQLDSTTVVRDNNAKRLAELSESLATTEEETSQLEETFKKVSSEVERHDAELAESREHLKATREAVKKSQTTYGQLRERRAVVSERIAVLEEIEANMEGIGSGVQELLEIARETPEGPLSAIEGMVADVVRIEERSDALMIASALGERAEHLVISGSRLVDMMARGEFKVPGRVGLIRMQTAPPPRFLREDEIDGKEGVIGRADRFVTTDEKFRHVVDWLLGDTWLVETLDDAVRYHREMHAPPRFVTRKGEVVDRDGRMLVGPQSTELDLIPRRAELEHLQTEVERLDEQVATHEKQLQQLVEQQQSAESRIEEVNAAADASHSELAQARARYESACQRRDEISVQHTSVAAEQQRIEATATSLTSQLSASQAELTSVRELVATLESWLNDDGDKLQRLEAHHKDLAEELAQSKSRLADCEERLDTTKTQRDQLQRDQDERVRALSESRKQADRAVERRMASELAILNVSSELNELMLQDVDATKQVRDIQRQREAARAERTERSDELNAIRDRIRKVEQRQHTLEMEAERIRRDRDSMAERLLEDYGIAVDELVDSGELSLEEQEERAEVDQEIADLRRKITNLGSVNMDALDELTDLESRYNSLSGQYQDLIDAKEALERIIQKINTDSRRLFSETLEAIRANFQVLFRKVFGGGSADIILEEGEDILESGIDIIATPPGKQSLGLSLLSGGERALTAVTLLMAIFEYRPSPFCVLDEVDGPLDEANIGRFIDVLRDFLKWTKFVVVTHSKKTMTAAHTLYGVTMQESGVSKRVSVTFEEVSEDGHISQSAIDRAEGAA
ncbi:MAG: chromosome segregation protein SMC [Planctomycetota bacterium]